MPEGRNHGIFSGAKKPIWWAYIICTTPLLGLAQLSVSETLGVTRFILVSPVVTPLQIVNITGQATPILALVNSK